MPGPIIHESVAQTEAQLLPYGAEHRLTVVCGLIAPTGEIALAQTVKSAAEDPPEMGLKLPQGDIQDGELLAEAYLRELEEEVGVRASDIAEIHGVALSPPHIGGRARGDKPDKAYGLVYGLTHGKPNLRIFRPAEIALTEWRGLSSTGELFEAQRRAAGYEDRGGRSLQMLRDISTHYVDTKGNAPLQD